jgi:hypothetical protein
MTDIAVDVPIRVAVAGAAAMAGPAATVTTKAAAVRRALMHREFGNRSRGGKFAFGLGQRGPYQPTMCRPVVAVLIRLGLVHFGLRLWFGR